MSDPRYPIGRYEQKPFSEEQKTEWLNNIRQLPTELEYAIQNLDAAQLQSRYREGGWTIHQLVHHVADSHMNAYVRFKLALTEDDVTVKSYEEQLWAELDDVRKLPVNVSITLLHALHNRLYAAIKDLRVDQWNRTLNYPGKPAPVTIWFLLGMYSWHGKHHTAHILSYRKANHI
ncbi:MAG TPA: putative metal-dependent hydrolase [Puia sp.]|nr:putative metal-dependent hydrolase [Puia sp.]